MFGIFLYLDVCALYYTGVDENVVNAVEGVADAVENQADADRDATLSDRLKMAGSYAQTRPHNNNYYTPSIAYR